MEEMEDAILFFSFPKEYRILAIKGKEIIELEKDLINLKDVQEGIAYWQNEYPGYVIDAEEY